MRVKKQALCLWIILLSLCGVASIRAQDLSAQGGAKAQDGVAAIIDGRRVVTMRELDASIGHQLYILEERIYQLRRAALNDLIARIVLDEAAKARGISADELRRRLAPEHVEIAPSQIEQAYAESSASSTSMDEDEAKQRIRIDLEGREKLARYKAALDEIKSQAKVVILLNEPHPPPLRVSDDGPSKGPQNAPVSIVVFSDFQCPYCKQATSTVEQVLSRYGGSVRLVFKHLPLPMHPQSFKAAQASICAQNQGKFWDYHDRLFASSDLSEQSLERQAAELGLNLGQFKACMDSEASRAAVLKDMREARLAGVQATPTFIINGRLLRGARGVEDFSKAIDVALNSKAQN